MVRITVAGKEALQPDQAGRLRRSDQHRAADAALDQADAAQDQGPHDAFAEIGLRDQQRAQPLRLDQQGLDIALGAAIDQRDPAGKLADFGQKLSRPLVDHRRHMAEPVALGDGDMAGQQHEHARAGLAGFEQHLAVAVALDFAEPAHALDLGGRERRKRLVVARAERRQRGAFIDAAVQGRGICRHTVLTLELFRFIRFGRPLLAHRGLTDPATGLRFPPLQVFAQRLAQPVLAHGFTIIRLSLGLVGHGAAGLNGLCLTGEMTREKRR